MKLFEDSLEPKSFDFSYIKYKFGFEEDELLAWIKETREKHTSWYERLNKECFMATFDRYFKDLWETKNHFCRSHQMIINKFGYKLDFILEEVYLSIKYTTCATQMDIDKKRGTKFFETPNIDVVSTPDGLFVFDVKNNNQD